MARKVAFTDRFLRSLKPSAPGAREVIWDLGEPGFGVRYGERGDRVTLFCMSRIGKGGAPTRRKIGKPWTVPLRDGAPLPMALAKARDEARTMLALMKAGTDPTAKAAEAEAAIEREAENVFERVAERWLDERVFNPKTPKNQKKPKKPLRRGAEIARLIRKRPVEKWKGRPIGSITRSESREWLEGESGGRHLHSALRSLFGWAVEKDIIDASPIAAISAARTFGEIEPRSRVLNDVELRALWKATAPEGGLGVPLAPLVRLLLLSGQRLRQVAEGRWDEIDFDNGTWLFSARRMKSDVAFELPLSAAILDILRALPSDGSPFIFPTARGNRPVSGFSAMKRRLDKALAKLNNGKPIDPWVLHDLRRTARTRLGGLPVPSNVSEMILAHAQPQMHQIYDLYAYRTEKLRGLTLWQAELARIVGEPGPSNVVAFQR